ncbi:MAG: hypothetical protein Q7S48_04035 [bacterium]|nr:hypothetical protein [bacterium]
MTVLYNRLAVVFVVFASACTKDTAGIFSPDLGSDTAEAAPDALTPLPTDLGVDLATVSDAEISDMFVPPDAPSPDAYVARCGNGIMDIGEACDEGEENDNLVSNACRTDCTIPDCGDGVVDSGEECEGIVGMQCTTLCATSGVAVCQPEGCSLGACIPPEDVCNGTDDNCDGVADDWFACVAGAVEDCTPACGERGSRTCSDECESGDCVATDTICDDSDLCTVSDHCDGDVCVADPIVCVSPDPAECANGTTRRTFAAVGTCAEGACSYASTDTVCNDADACTADACSAGACTTSPITCTDGNLCTDDWCDSSSGCVFTPNAVACDDADPCTTDDVCGGGSCTGTPVVCTSPSSAECANSTTLRTYAAVGTCNAGGACFYAPIDTVCNTSPTKQCLFDGLTLRTYVEQGMCVNETCEYMAVDTVCDDGESATIDFCGGDECDTTCSLGTVLCDGLCLSEGCWRVMRDSPLNRRQHSSVWTGSEMIIWGGMCTVGGACYVENGATYDPLLDTWEILPATIAEARALHTAIWTSSEMVIWGGYNAGNSVWLHPIGAALVTSPSSWRPLTDSVESIFFLPRNNHTAVWTGSEMVIWGGEASISTYNSGARYSPIEDSWTTVATSNGPSARTLHTAVWTGSEMVIWGGCASQLTSGCGRINTGGRYNPADGAWLTISAVNVPTARYGHTAVWTGSEMIVWGGTTTSGTTFTGGRYDPISDTWISTSLISAPTARLYHTAVWTGSEMVIWGGQVSGGNTSTGGRYNPTTDAWVVTPIAGAPSERNGHTAVWTGSEMIVWGGRSSSGLVLSSGGLYTPP